MKFRSLTPLLIAASAACLPAAQPDVLPGTAPLEVRKERREWMHRIVGEWDAYFLERIKEARAGRSSLWNRDPSSPEAYERSVAPNRERFRRYIGAVDERPPPGEIELVATLQRPALRGETEHYRVLSVRWQAFPGVYARGLLLVPRGRPLAFVVALPDADQTPEMLAGINPGLSQNAQYVRRLAEGGAAVLIPALVDRRSIWSGDERLNIFTNQTHREWIYRQAAEMGRHIIGYEVQSVAAAIDIARAAMEREGRFLPVGVSGYGEGGLIALYTAAVDTRIDAAWVSGYFSPRERVWSEPLYRNVWGLLEEFGDAEIASLVAPRALIVEHSFAPEVPTPTLAVAGRISVTAAKGALTGIDGREAGTEFIRARGLAGRAMTANWSWIAGGAESPVEAGSERALAAFSRHLDLDLPGTQPEPLRNVIPFEDAEIDGRQESLVKEWQEHTQKLVRLSEYVREDFFWKGNQDIRSPEAWAEAVRPLREKFWNDVIGKLPDPSGPMNARTRRLTEYENPHWTGYEVFIDVYPGVSAWAYLLVPNDLRPGERRPVVVCQHGATSNPNAAVTRDPEDGEFRLYRGFGATLAERGFIVLSPFNPTAGTGESFRQLHRKANPLRKSVFSYIAANHQRFLEFLQQQPFVDPERIGFYGLSYGGKTAMRVPAMLEGYALSICSGDWNDYVQKMTSVTWAKRGFMFRVAYETTEWNLGHTFNYGEMAALIAPRPFMVEIGYLDTVPILEWGAAEYSKVQKLYFYLGIPDRTTMAYFDGPHRIDEATSFPFLHRHLNWPEPDPGNE